jgi:exonuclease III
VNLTVVIKQATRNINAITNRTRVGMLTEYIRRHGLDIVFRLEIIDPALLPMPGYDIYYSIATDLRGTPILARNDILLMNINKLTSERAIAAECKGLYIVNIFAPTGKAKRKEREYFYNAEVPQLLQIWHREIIVRATSTV